jgi:hypothetical protein
MSKRRNRIIFSKLLRIYSRQQRKGNINFSEAGREAGCSRKAAAQAWETGWDTKRHPYAETPLKEMVQLEQMNARALIEDENLDIERQRILIERTALQNAADARAQEGRMVKVVRMTATGLLKQCIELIQASAPLTEKMKIELKLEAASGTLDADGTLSLLSKVARHAQSCTDIVDKAMRLERLHLGEPEKLIGTTSGPTSVEEALSILAQEGSILDSIGTVIRDHAEVTVPEGLINVTEEPASVH